jgi:hypothetical protein
MPMTRGNGVTDSQSAFMRAVLDLVPVNPAGPTPVILIEQQSSAFGPVEMEALWPQMIAAAVSLGIAVVEPAGNGRVDLDQFTPPPGTPNPSDRSAFDSGAIMVATSGTPIAPGDLRDLLSDPFVNSQSRDPNGDRIGVMPDLASIISHGV